MLTLRGNCGARVFGDGIRIESKHHGSCRAGGREVEIRHLDIVQKDKTVKSREAMWHREVRLVQHWDEEIRRTYKERVIGW